MGIKIINKKRFSIFLLGAIVIFALVFGGGYAIYKHFAGPKPLYKMNFKQAGNNGEKKVYQVVIKINKGSGNGGYERGDIIMTAPEDKQWSLAEQEGFLIVKMNLTKDQADLLTIQKGDPTKEIRREGEKPKTQTTPEDRGRKFAADLAKMGISDDQQKGKIISDKVFEGLDVIIEKK